jgi:lipoprotein-anchoring transpeptidase ErfK/SrfK
MCREAVVSSCRALGAELSVKAVLGVCAFGLVMSLACSPAAARSRQALAHKDKETEHASKEPFGDIPKGPLQIYISINQQKLHLYSDGVHVADTPVATGVPSLPTPLGVFSVIQKQRFHVSNIYSNAPMPFMQRITWSGVALHEGENIGHPASHGCIRMPHDFAVRLYGLTRLGVPVVIARAELKPVEFADPHLFVRKDKPPVTVAATPASAAAVKTATPADQSAPATTDQLGLRVDPQDGPPAAVTPAVAIQDTTVPAPPAKPADVTPSGPAKNTPIAIFISRKEKKIYVRQDFAPLFETPIIIEHPDQPIGTHVFTALEFLDDHATLRWNVVSLPGEPPAKPARGADNEKRSEKPAGRRRRDEDEDKIVRDLPPPQTPAEALARIDIPQDVVDRISQLMGPGSSLIVSDQGLGDETGDGTDFIVVTQ